ncbi:MAG: DUF2889 domain-containing protein, partial [Acidimicrobiia bacterium]|nr:DUF2889 domain-containing protein [Acidimicrobiia bacterium]
PFPEGAYRRRIRLVVTEPGVVEAALEDDFHHFVITLRHDGEIVTAADAGSKRWPWTTCPDAAGPLHAIEGMALSPRCLAVGDHADPKKNCTHMFDLAGLAVAHAARGGVVGTTRQYDVEIPSRVQAGAEVDGRLWRDGVLLHTWTLVGRGCTAPPPFSEAPWRGGFLRWADQAFVPDDSEPVIVLRRACDIGMGRGMDLDAVERSKELESIMSGICFSMQPEQAAVGVRMKGTIRDFDADPDAMLADGP